jgi:hypothetical protein
VQTAADGGATSVETKFPNMVVNGVTYTEKEPAAKALLEACKGIKEKNVETPIGEYMGFKMGVRFESFGNEIKLLLRGAITYQIELGTDTFGNITRINHGLEGLPKMLENARSQLENVHKQQEAAKVEIEKPFALEAELAEKETRLALLNADLNIDGDGGLDVMNDPEVRSDMEESPDDDYDYAETRQAVVAKGRMSLLDGIRRHNGDTPTAAQGKGKSAELDI